MSPGFRLPSRFGPPLFSALLSGSMSFIVAGVATWKAAGIDAHFLDCWIAAWLNSWPIAFVAVMIVAPAVRRIVAAMVEPPMSSHQTQSANTPARNSA